MCKHDIRGDKCSPTDDVVSRRIVTDGGIRPSDLTQFQLDILAVLAEEPRYGLAIKDELETLYGDAVNHGRLYPNIDTLVEKGLATKRPLDKRTKEVRISDEGRDVLRERIDWLAARAGLKTVEDEHRLADAAPAVQGGDD